MRTLIIGTGISAATWVRTAKREIGENRKAIGGPHLWQKLDPNHPMGQSSRLLTGHSAQNKGLTHPDEQKFMLAKDFKELVDERLKRGVEEVDRGWVKHISRNGSKYVVEVCLPPPDGKPCSVEADRVIIATGPGPLRPLEIPSDTGKKMPVNLEAMNGHVVSGNDFLSPDWKPPETLVKRNLVIYGGSATASWVAETALVRGYRVVLWFVRPDDTKESDQWNRDSRFKGAFPAGGRNRKVEKDLEGVRHVFNLQEIRLDQKTNKVEFLVNGQYGSVFYRVDLFVYALGQANTESAGIRAMLDKNSVGKIVPFYDANRAISDQQCVVAMGTEDKTLLIVGSALQSLGKAIENTKRYSEIAKTLPLAARPEEGIILAVSSIEALNNYIPVQSTTGRININFNTCNRTQLAAYIAQTTSLPPSVANRAVERIIETRAKSIHGITEKEVHQICAESIPSKL
jgi:hypothetical protein